jgi:ribonuclease D
MQPHAPTTYLLLDTVPAVREYLLTLASSPALAIDVEADSLFSYQEKVCLVQISTPAANAILDPLAAREGLQALGPLLADANIRKVFHGGDYDIRMLKKDFGFAVHNVADTMIAAQLVGRAKFGLAALLCEEFGLELDKGYQRANWAYRPLDPQHLRYAARDTAYLLELWQRLRAELVQLERLEWAEEEFRLLEDITPAPAREPTCFDVKGSNRLPPRVLCILQNLVQVRDQAARAWDRPLFKVLSDQVLLDWAQSPPRRRDQVLRTRAANRGILGRLAPQVLDAVQKGLATPEADCPHRNSTPFTPMSHAQRTRLARLKQVREEAALELALAPGLLVNSATLEKMAYLPPPEGVALMETALKRWQQQVLGERLRAAMKA